MRVYLVGDALLTKKYNHDPKYMPECDEEITYQEIHYTRQQLIAKLLKKKMCRAFYKKDAAEEYAVAKAKKPERYYHGDNALPLFVAEIPDWVSMTLSSDGEGGRFGLNIYEINSRFIQKIISIALDEEKILSNEDNYKNTLKWLVGSILFSSAVVGGFLWAGVIAGWLVSSIVGVGSLVLVGLFKKGVGYYQKFHKPVDSILEPEPFDDKNNISFIVEDVVNSDRPHEWKGRPVREVKALSANIHRLLARYDQQKGYRRRCFGDQKDIVQLRRVIESSASEEKCFSSKEMFDLCKAMLEEATEVGHESHKVLHEIKGDMTIKGDDKLAPFALAQFLKCVTLLEQKNFERLCACSGSV